MRRCIYTTETVLISVYDPGKHPRMHTNQRDGRVRQTAGCAWDKR